MICYQDKCWCSAKQCEQYKTCKGSFSFAVKERMKEDKPICNLPIMCRDKSEVCRWYKCKN